MKYSPRYKIIYFFLFAILLSHNPALAQTVGDTQSARTVEEEKITEDEVIKSLEGTEAPAKKDANYSLTYGGWVTSYFWHFDDLDNDTTEEDWVKDMLLEDVRLWAKAELYKSLTTYARVRYYHVERAEAANYTGDKDGLYGPYIDMLYAKYDFKPKHDIPLEITAGRQYLKIGRGIAYSDVHDGVRIEAALGDWTVKAFGARTKPHDASMDYSAPDYKRKNKRNFWAGEVAYTGLEKHAIYAYSLIQRDHFEENPADINQDYRYHSEYYGIGATGEPTEQTKYWAEIIKECGKGYTDASQAVLSQNDVDAWAYNAGGKYRFDCPTHPVAELETSFGSGDKNRQRVTNTINGNTSGDDNNFLYFGTFSAGYALMPRLSNIFIHKAAFSLKPFEAQKSFNLDEIAVGAKYYIYHKHRSSGGIYDVEATRSNKFIGQEIDLYLYWKIRPNLLYSMRYGLFFPGSAYPDSSDNTSEYIQTRLTFIF